MLHRWSVKCVAVDREYTAPAYRRRVLHVVADCMPQHNVVILRFPLFSSRFLQPLCRGPLCGLEVSLGTLEGRSRGVWLDTVVEKSLNRKHLVPSTGDEEIDAPYTTSKQKACTAEKDCSVSPRIASIHEESVM